MMPIEEISMKRTPVNIITEHKISINSCILIFFLSYKVIGKAHGSHKCDQR